MKKIYLVIALLFLASVAVAARLLPHPANFAPISAAAIFAGVYLPKKWAILLPVLIMLASDFILGFYDVKLMLVVYGCFIFSGLLGILIRNKRGFLTVASASLGASLAFFIATNLAVWLFSSWYPHNFSGLLLCYTAAVPFFKNTMLGDLFFVGVFFGSWELAKLPVKKFLSNVATKSLLS